MYFNVCFESSSTLKIVVSFEWLETYAQSCTLFFRYFVEFLLCTSLFYMDVCANPKSKHIRRKIVHCTVQYLLLLYTVYCLLCHAPVYCELFTAKIDVARADSRCLKH